MMINLSGHNRDRFVSDLRDHREAFSLSDKEYAERILKVSPNTFRKCLELSRRSPLALKRHTFVSIFTGSGLDPKAYGLSIGVPSQTSPHGGYKTSDYRFLCGRFFLYRRTFLSARHITRSILEIQTSDAKECLAFHELHYYDSESGVREEIHYRGDVYLNQERSILSMPAYFEGQVRLTLLHMPERRGGRERRKMRGALLAFGIPKGYWQPTISSVYVEGPIDDKRANPRELCRTIWAELEEYQALSSELAHTEEHATINVPLMWFKAQGKTTV